MSSVRVLVAMMCVLVAVCANDRVADAGKPKDPLLNPFLSLSELLEIRGTPQKATQRLVVRTESDVGGEERSTNGLLDLADDWAQWSTPGSPEELHDFSLGQVFYLDGLNKSVHSVDLVAYSTFFYWERLNREAINEAMKAIGSPMRSDECDTGTELRMASPNSSKRISVHTSANGDEITVLCDGRQIGKVRLSKTRAPSSTLWPVIAFQIPIHPRLLESARSKGRFPAEIETEFLLFGKTRSHHRWILSRVQEISSRYPLDATYGEPYPKDLSAKLDPEIIALAREATKGTYGGGPPSIESWKAKVKAIAENDRAAAVMEALQVAFMFPAYLERCSKRKGDWLCRFIADSRDLFRKEPALAALTTIVGLHGRDEQTAEKALESMYKAKSSPLCQHVALLAAFAIVMRHANTYTVTKAQKAGLPVNDLEVLQKAVRAYPYNPLYWLDLADTFSFGEWDFSTGIFLSKVALSLPMPDAMRGKDVAGRRAFLSDLPSKTPSFYP